MLSRKIYVLQCSFLITTLHLGGKRDGGSGRQVGSHIRQKTMQVTSRNKCTPVVCSAAVVPCSTVKATGEETRTHSTSVSIRGGILLKQSVWPKLSNLLSCSELCLSPDLFAGIVHTILHHFITTSLPQVAHYFIFNANV